MNYQNILIPTDGSEYTDAAVEQGIELAKITGGKITALYVLDQSVYSNMPMDAAIVNVYETLQREGKNAVAHIKELAERNGIAFEEKITEGIPSNTVCTMSPNFDIVVMGTLGRTGMNKVLMGSVAEKVIEGAKCPVMIVRQPAKKEQTA